MRLATLGWLPSKACKIMPLAVNFPISDQESRILPNTTQTWVPFGQTWCYPQFCSFCALHCTSSPFSTMVPGSCPKVVRNCRIAAFAVKIYSRMGPTNSTAWKNNVRTLPLQLQHWRLCDWENYCGYKNKENYHCIVAGVALENDDSGHEMSKQR